MQITPVDRDHNLFRIEQAVPPQLSHLVATTDWINLPWQKQPGQEHWNRRRVDETAIAWIDQWHACMNNIWPNIEQQLGMLIQPYSGTAFWIDEPGFYCGMHTDGELPGSLHLIWQGSGTAFYWYNDPQTLRYQVPAIANAGYIMINLSDDTGYRTLQWHAMLEPVPQNTFRLTSYTWIVPQ